MRPTCFANSKLSRSVTKAGFKVRVRALRLASFRMGRLIVVMELSLQAVLRSSNASLTRRFRPPDTCLSELTRLLAIPVRRAGLFLYR